jgi:hypothetical protein
VNVLIIRLFLLLLFGAMASYLLAIVFDQLAMTSLAGHLTWLGSMVLLSAFSLILSAGLALLARLMVASICDYFSTQQSIERRLLFFVNKHNRINQFFELKKSRLVYLNQQQRKQLLKKNEQNSALP